MKIVLMKFSERQLHHLMIRGKWRDIIAPGRFNNKRMWVGLIGHNPLIGGVVLTKKKNESKRIKIR